MTEYVPCVLVRELSTTQIEMLLIPSPRGGHYMKQRPVYTEELRPVEMSEFVKLVQGKRTLLPGPFKLAQVPEWAKSWFKSR